MNTEKGKKTIPYRSSPIITEVSKDDEVVTGVTWTTLWTKRSLGRSSMVNSVTCDLPTLAGPKINTGTVLLAYVLMKKFCIATDSLLTIIRGPYYK